MAEKKEPRDEKLIEELYERLWWYTHEASEEEFDEKEVDAITRLLDVLEPVYDDRAYEPGADAALQRFWQRDGEEEKASPEADTTSLSDKPAPGTADADGKPDPAAASSSFGVSTASPVSAASEAEEPETAEACTKPKLGRSGKRRRRLIRAAVGAAACVVLLISVNVGSYAIRNKSFFEIVREGAGRTEITVTGNVEGFEENEDDSIECSSWDDAEKLVGENILKPEFIPDGYELKSLSYQYSELRKTIVGWYEKEDGKFLRIRIKVYPEEFKKGVLQYDRNWTLVEKIEEKNVQFYGCEGMIEASFSKEKCLYYILSNEDIETLKLVVEGMLE